MLAEESRDDERLGRRTVLWQVFPGLMVGYYAEPRVRVPALIVRSVSNCDDVDDVVSILRAKLTFLEDDELLANVSTVTTTEELVAALLLLGFGVPVHFNQRYFDILSASSRDAREEVRSATVWAIAYAEWGQFIPVLKTLASSDKSRSVRKLAKGVLRVFAGMRLSA